MAIKEQIILEGVNKTQKAFSDAQKSLNRIETNTHRAGSAFSKLQSIVVGAAAAIGAIKLSKSFLNVAVEVENLGIQLKFLTGSAEEGARAMDILTEFASGVPFELQQIANAAPNLLTVVDSTDELNEMLAITGDIAAATGLDFKTTAEQMQRAFSGGIAAADIFREKGVKALLGFEEGVRYNAEQTKELIVSSFRDGTMVMKGASAEMADTFTGTMSMLSDKTFQFQKHLMDSGPFDFIKVLLQDLNTFIDSKFGSIENAAEVMGVKIVQAFQAAAIGFAKFADMITPIVKLAARSVKGLVDMTNSLPATIKAVGIIGFMMLGVKGKLVVLAIGAVFDKVRLMFADIMDFMASGKEKIAGIMDALGFDGVAESMRQNATDIKSENERIRKAIEGTKDSVVDDMEEIIISMGDFGDITAEEFEKAGPITQAFIKKFEDVNETLLKNGTIIEGLNYEEKLNEGIGAVDQMGQSLVNVNQIWADHQKKIEKAKEENKKYVNSLQEITSAYGGAYMDSILKADKAVFEATGTTEDAVKEAYKLVDAFILAANQADAFGGAYMDSVIKKPKEIAKIEQEVTEEIDKEARRRLFIDVHNNKQRLDFHKKISDGIIAHEEKMRKKELFLAKHALDQKRKFHELEAQGVKEFNEQNISYLQAYTEGFKGQIGQQKSVLDQLRDAGANAFNGMVDSLTNFVMTGKFKFKDFANMVIRELIRIAVQAAATFAIKKALSAFGGPFGAILGGFLADGGPAQAGKAYVVGEEGPELFVPNSSGKVIPNDEMRPGRSTETARSVQVNFTVNAIDPQSFQDTLSTQRDTIVGIINEAVIERGRPAIA